MSSGPTDELLSLGRAASAWGYFALSSERNGKAYRESLDNALAFRTKIEQHVPSRSSLDLFSILGPDDRRKIR